MSVITSLVNTAFRLLDELTVRDKVPSNWTNSIWQRRRESQETTSLEMEPCGFFSLQLNWTWSAQLFFTGILTKHQFLLLIFRQTAGNNTNYVPWFNKISDATSVPWSSHLILNFIKCTVRMREGTFPLCVSSSDFKFNQPTWQK